MTSQEDVVVEKLAKTEIAWWRSHHIRDDEAEKCAIIAQLKTLYPRISDGEAREAARCKTIAGALHDTAERFDVESIWEDAERWMQQYFAIIVMVHNRSIEAETKL